MNICTLWLATASLATKFSHAQAVSHEDIGMRRVTEGTPAESPLQIKEGATMDAATEMSRGTKKDSNAWVDSTGVVHVSTSESLKQSPLTRVSVSITPAADFEKITRESTLAESQVENRELEANVTAMGSPTSSKADSPLALNWHGRLQNVEKNGTRPLLARHELLATSPTIRATQQHHKEISAAMIKAGGLQLGMQTPTTGAPLESTTPVAGATTTAALVAASPPVEKDGWSWSSWIMLLLLFGCCVFCLLWIYKQSSQTFSMRHMPSRLGEVKIGSAGADQEEIAKKTDAKPLAKSLLANMNQSDSDSDDDLKKAKQTSATNATGEGGDNKKSNHKGGTQDGGSNELQVPSTRSRYKRG